VIFSLLRGLKVLFLYLMN